ncbi:MULTISPECIES: response regulator transcription factor [Methylococcus]|jgi:DNA-binding response OmpR family regulator|uniref:Phosphate regulon transcriptional regulatory protein PhoB n=1 Tax=Methylococcus capsulatus TaxID=414 RepID=A0AA35V5Y9_METCP|nr:response regulator transcription factor [Methylococcus capsulatus]CAI8860879.1 Sensory transduction protein RegX3 [Methylococcus capsulatus]
MKRILVIEDDTDIGDMLGINLRDEGYAVEIARDGIGGLACLKADRFDLLVLDLMLPGIDGLEICRQVRRMPHYQPIVIISAKSTETQRVLGLELGADDYLTKPFSIPELIARIRALFRRVEAMERESQAKAGVIVRGPLTIDPVGYSVMLEGRPVALTLKEFELLLFFARHPGQAFTRLALLDRVWGYSHDGYEHTVNSHINRLRAKIERDPGRPEFIQTVWGVGYKFVDFGENRP